MDARHRPRAALIWGLLCLAAPGATPAEEPPGAAADGTAAGRLLLFPRGDLYGPYVADPQRLGFGAQLVSVTGAGIADSGDGRFYLKAGGRPGLVRHRPRDPAGRAWQVSLEVGFDALFDRQHSLDNIGWDGNYGLAWTAGREDGAGTALKVGILHTSAHVGDELEERTGRRRLGYTREELLVGLSRRVGRWRSYAEGAWGHELRNRELQEPGRAQAGLEVEVPGSLWKGRLGWYAATDLSATEERDWRLDVAVQAGLMLPSAGRTWRAALEWYDGRPPLGEFFQDTETWLSFGIWMDL